MRCDSELVARTDSSVAKAIAQRLGVGRVRHLQTSCLWVQQFVARRQLRIASIPTALNPADAGTKVLTGGRLRMLSYIVHLVNEKGNYIGETEYSQQMHVRTVARMARQGHGAGMMLIAQMMGAAMHPADYHGDERGVPDVHRQCVVHCSGPDPGEDLDRELETQL